MTPSLVVVVPVYRPALAPDEEIALTHLEHFLPHTDRCLVMPHGLVFERPGYRTVHFPTPYFASLAGYNRLMLARRFYDAFADYDFLLLHQLDAIVLGAGIRPFLDLGVDYLGAPWVEYEANGSPRLAGVGNGGLSLRCVEAFRRLIGSRVRTTSAREYYRSASAGAPAGRRAVYLGKAALKAAGIRNSIRREIQDSLGNEDDFIAAQATKYSPGFRIGTVDEALAFAFESEPRYCLEQAGGRLPWGAHAWARYDREFWEPHLLT